MFLRDAISCAYASRSATSPLLKYAVRNGGQRGNHDAGVKSSGLGWNSRHENAKRV